MAKSTYTIHAGVWRYQGPAAWFFITIPKKHSEEIKAAFRKIKRGWGSIPVEVRIGKSMWKTSIFPDSKAGAYLLPIKASIRKKEKIKDGDIITLSIEVKI